MPQPTNTHSLQLTASSSQRAAWTPTSSVISGGGLAITCRFYLDSVSQQTICARWGPGTANKDDLLVDVTGTRLRALVSGTGNEASRSEVQWAYEFEAGVTYAIDLRWDGSQSGADNQWTLCINGRSQGTPTEVNDDSVSSIHDGDEDFVIGARNSSGGYTLFFDGRIDEFSYYGDVQKSDRRLFYKFDEDLTDSSGNSRDLTGTNSPTFGDPLSLSDATLTKIGTGTAVVALCVEIEGYPYVLTNWHDTDEVLAAYGCTDWTGVLGGLEVTGEYSQEITPLDPEIDSGTMTFVVGDFDGADLFGSDVFSRFKSSGKSANITTSAEPTDATLHVDNNGDLATSPAFAYVGTERIRYGSKSSTDRLTQLIRGYNAPFPADESTRWARFHAISTTAGAATYRPVVTDWKRVWLGCHIALRVYRVDNGVLGTRAGSHLLFAGTIADIQDTEGGTEIVAADIRKQIADTMLLGDQYSAEPLEGTFLGSRDFIRVIEISTDSTGVRDRQNELIDATALGLPAQKTAQEVVDAINEAIDDSATLDKAWDVHFVSGREVKFNCAFVGDFDRARILVAMTDNIARLLGFDTSSNNQVSDGNGSVCRLYSSVEEAGTDTVVSIIGSFPHAYTSPQIASGTTLTVDGETGTFVNQGPQMPPRIRATYDTATSGTWGFLRYRDFTFLAKQLTATTFTAYWDDDVYRLFEQTSESVAVSASDSVVRAGDPIPRFTQVLFFEEDFSTCIPRLFASTGDVGYNHATYDAYDRQLGAAIPWSLLGDAFIESVNEMAEIGETHVSILLDKPTRLVEILIPELGLRNAHLVFKRGGLVFQRPSGAFILGGAEHVLTDDTMWSDPDNPETVRPTTTWSLEYVTNVLKVEYDRSLDGKLNSTREVRNATSIAEYGVSRPITIKARNTVTKGRTTDPAAIEGLIATLAGDLLAIYDEPLQVVDVSVMGDVLISMAPGDSVSLSNSFVRYHGDGTRGVTNVAAYCLRTAFDPTTLRGAVTLVLTGDDLARAANYSPAAKIDETHTSGSFTSGYDSTNDKIRLKAHEFSSEDEDADVSYFQVGSEIRIIEKSPATPGTPQDWTVTVSAVDEANHELTIDGDLTGFDTSLEYYVISEDYAAATTAQKTATYIADNADDKIVDTERSRTWRDNSLRQSTSGGGATGATDVQYDYPPTDGQWWSEGKPIHPAMMQALIRATTNLVSHRTAPQFPPWIDSPVAFSSPLDVDQCSVAPFPVSLRCGFDRIRVLVLGPRIRRTSATVSASVTVYSSAARPRATATASGLEGVEFIGATRSVTFDVTSSSFINSAAQELTLAPDPTGLMTWITVVGTQNAGEIAGFHTWYVGSVQ